MCEEMHYENFYSAILSFSHLRSLAFYCMFFIIKLAKGDILNKVNSENSESFSCSVPFKFEEE